MKAFLRRIVLALATGYIFFFFSELVFWSFWRPTNTLGGYIITWILYSVVAHVFLSLVHHFRVRNIWAVFLAGAAFGWIIEGLIVMTFFGAEGIPFPVTISWTALAWHALISVLLGWYTVRSMVEEWTVKKMLLFSVGLGLFWGFWANTWTLESPPLTIAPEGFLAFSAVTTLLFIGAHVVSRRFSVVEFKSTKTEVSIIALAALVYFLVVTVPAQPVLAPLALVPMFALLYFGLRKNKQREPEGSILLQVNPVPLRRYIPLLVVPVVATVTYEFFFPIAASIHPNIVVLIISTLLGFAYFVIALYRMYYPKVVA